ncbi:MAG: alpha/beta fold hydrolase [Gammaproteobacteria bacterium]
MFRLVFQILLLAPLVGGAATADQNPPGRLLDVGGFKLHLYCVGLGSPTVVLDAGLGGSAADWTKVQQLVRQTTNACIYDRAGYGWSDPGPAPRTSGRLASELRTLLARAKVPPPYIVVGHSFGGYNARLFSSFYPDDTVGLVLVDSPHEAQVPNLFQHQIIRMIDPHGLLQRIWTPELAGVLSSADLGAIAPLLGLKAKTLHAILGELAAFKESGDELAASLINPDLPLVVIMHGLRVLPSGLGDQMEREWLQLLRRLALRQRHSRFVIAEKSAHLVPLEQPELVAAEIHRMVQAYSGNSIHKP